jgi:hypothetical protein
MRRAWHGRRWRAAHTQAKGTVSGLPARLNSKIEELLPHRWQAQS